MKLYLHLSKAQMNTVYSSQQGQHVSIENEKLHFCVPPKRPVGGLNSIAAVF